MLLNYLIAPVLFLVLCADAVGQLENCTYSGIGDGSCNFEYNNAACNYDGGDCCECTCEDGPSDYCGLYGFDCQDPEAPDPAVGCEEDPVALTPCSSTIPRQWVVQDVVSASAMADAVRCSGGTFDVEWRGDVVVAGTIFVMNGTTVHLYGTDSGAGIDGGGSIRMFTVVDASLIVSNMTINNGKAVSGGCVAAVRSDLRFTHTSFTGCVTETYGGAVFAADNSTIHWEGETAFVDNKAGLQGGAVCVELNTSATWKAQSSFIGNAADYDGGALSIRDNSTASWEGESLFTYNSAGSNGGALYVKSFSSASWAMEASFISNTADGQGGALKVVTTSTASWFAQTSFIRNTGYTGGALDAGDYSTISWEGNTSFVNNTSVMRGGALNIHDYSNASWNANTSFTGNIANMEGGALYIFTRSSASWQAQSYFVNNSAVEGGGALIIGDNSSASWQGPASFINNTVFGDTTWNQGLIGNGGALFISYYSSASWEADVSFVGNVAAKEGGSISISYASEAVCMGKASFMNNNAENNGGAVHVTNQARVVFEAEAEFYHNSASGDGGACYLYTGYGRSSASTLVLNGPARFQGNDCRGNGGALALSALASMTFVEDGAKIASNTAGIAGGGVSITGVTTGVQFFGVRFESNLAQLGGAVYATDSGISVERDEDGNPLPKPTTYKRCQFIGNRAGATGGAIDTGVGLDAFEDTRFARNSARAGGALRLAGRASLVNCTFVENVSTEDEGPAVHNVGAISTLAEGSFFDNIFECRPGTFLDFHEAHPSRDDLLDTVCKDCNTECQDCRTSQEVPHCSKELEHARSPGGATTLEMLLIDRGYWRATSGSRNILPCYNPEACRGGVTGAPDYCRRGYEGPYCSVCSKGFSASKGHTCTECSGNAAGIAGAGIVAVLAVVVVGVVLFSKKVHSGAQGTIRTILSSWRRRLLSLKIITVVWQILTQFATVANITYPNVYRRFLGGIDIVNLDLGRVLQTGCVVDMNLHHRLILSTLGPLLCLLIIGIAYLVAKRGHLRPDSASTTRTSLDGIRQKYLSLALLLTFVVYSTVSSTLFQMFACDRLGDGNIYVRTDYRIKCNSFTHKAWQVYAGTMILLYTVGIPVFYASLLLGLRAVLMDADRREEDAMARSTFSLWGLYRPRRFYYELIECLRRVLLAGVVVFMYPNTTAQVAIVLVIATFFMILCEALSPYDSVWDAWLSRLGHAIVFMSIYLALLLKIDVSEEHATSQKLFEVVLVAANVTMVVITLVEATVVSCAWLKRRKSSTERESNL